jgi:hypothetical protein
MSDVLSAAYCHPGEGRDPEFGRTIDTGFAGSVKRDQKQEFAERWIPACAGMTEGWMARLKQALSRRCLRIDRRGERPLPM